jgi:uncharacterized protein YjbI with pentapeptide repeats
MAAKTLLAYEGSDESLLTTLKASLAPLQWKGVIFIYDCEINSSSRAKELLGIADIILLLVSPQFLTSDYCYSAKLAEAIERHKQGKTRVFPVILHPAYWEKTPFSMLQAMPTKKAISLWEDKNLAFKEVVSAVEARATEMNKDISQAPTSQVDLHAHLGILKQGTKLWNQWREEHYEVQPSLQEANLSSTDLRGANLRGANLESADLSQANLSQADLSLARLHSARLKDTDLSNANLSFADLSEANLSFAILRGVDLRGANLSSADLRGANTSDTKLSDSDLRNANLDDANLTGADLVGANLVGANLTGVNLTKANLSLANLSDTNLNEALLSVTVFGSVDLRQTKGLENVEHGGPSIIDIHTLMKSEGHIPEVFLRGAGIPDTFITYARSLVGQPIDYYTCFLSYSNKDQAFAERLYADLQSKGVRCWFAPQDMKIGDTFYKRIDEAIRLYDRLLLVLSKDSIASTWIEKEVETAFEKEQQQSQRVLFPIRLDESVMQTSHAWAVHIRHTHHIGDFTRWKQHDDYQQALERLLRDLKAEA